MEGDPTGSAVAENLAGTAETPTDALPSEPTEAGVSSVESPEEIGADDTTPTPEDDTSVEAGADEGTTDQPQAGGLSRADRQFQQRLDALLKDPEKARQVLGPAIEPFIQQALKAQDDERQAVEQSRAQQEEAERAAEQARKEYAEYLGEPGEAERLQAEVADLNRQLRSELRDPKGVDIDALEAEIGTREARLERIAAGSRHHRTIAGEIWGQIGSDFASAAEFPELAADPALKARYLGAEGGIRGALGVLREAVRDAAVAEKDAEIARLRADHTKQVKAIESDRNAWRARAGGTEVADATSGAAAGGAGGSLIERLIREAGGFEQYAERAKRGDYAGINLSG